MTQIGDRVFYVPQGESAQAAIVVGFYDDDPDGTILNLVTFPDADNKPIVRRKKIAKDDLETSDGYWTETFPA